MLHVIKCLPHTSFLGYIAALSSNSWPTFGEIFLSFYYYNETYIDQQTVVPSFWFRWWRPGFLIGGILYDVGMLAYCIYMEDIFVVLLVVRLIMGLYQLRDQLWMINNWIPFFVHKQKQRFIFVRAYVTACIWYFVVGSTTWSGVWQERQDLFACVYYISMFLIIFGGGVPYLIRGGVDLLVKYRLHWNRNVFVLLAFSGLIMGIIGLIIGDGGGEVNNLIDTLDYHSVYILIYFALEFNTALFGHRFVVMYEELAWKYPNNPISSPPSTKTLFSNKETRPETSSGVISNKVACEEDISSVEFAPSESIPMDSVARLPPENHTENGRYGRERLKEDGKDDGDLEAAHGLLSRSATVKNDEACDEDVPLSSIKLVITESVKEGTVADSIKPSNEVEKLVEEDGKEEEDLEATYGLTSQPATVSVDDVPTEINASGKRLVTFQSGGIPTLCGPLSSSIGVNGNTESSSIPQNDIMTPETMLMLKRHELVLREVDKLFCIAYQMFVWEAVMWIAQIFLTLYLKSVNTPTPPGAEGYYCPTPLETTINSAQYANDLFFARRMRR